MLKKAKLRQRKAYRGKVPDYDQVRALPSLLNLSPHEAMKNIAYLVDGAYERSAEADMVHALKLGEELRSSLAAPELAADLNYVIANAWADLFALRHRGKPSAWQWKQPELEERLLALRRAAHSPGFASLSAGRRAQILTNTGNLLNTIGRPLEAVDRFDEALRQVPGFGMAEANRATALETIARCHYDPGHRDLLLHRAWWGLMEANQAHIEPAARQHYRELADKIRAYLPEEFLARGDPAPNVSLGKTKAEQRYRRWALGERLFLNPLQAIGPVSCAARDTLGLPSFVTAVGEGPGLIGMFTQMKQEYVSARFLAWEGIVAERPHYSDRETYLIDTLDYALYGLAMEKTKAAFRMAYSILDKCALLLNHYLKLGIDERMVNLNRIWFNGGNPKSGFNTSIVDTPNLALRGLFWVARDLHDREGLRDPIDPDAQDLKSIRDHLEHKYLKVHEWLPDVSEPSGLHDQYAKSVDRESLERKTLAMLRLARSAITCVSFGIHAEEIKRAADRSQGSVTPSRFLPKVHDKWKR